jgi:hypothetical protein
VKLTIANGYEQIVLSEDEAYNLQEICLLAFKRREVPVSGGFAIKIENATLDGFIFNIVTAITENYPDLGMSQVHAKTFEVMAEFLVLIGKVLVNQHVKDLEPIIDSQRLFLNWIRLGEDHYNLRHSGLSPVRKVA